MRDADPRAYACVRVCVGLSALTLCADLWPLRRALFTETGNLGPAVEHESFRVNLIWWVSTHGQISGVFALVAMACLGLVLGIWPRLNAWVVYLWTVSYSASAGIALGGFDTVARLTTFALAVSPAVTTWSVSRTGESQAPVPRYGLRLLQWQLMLIYWVTVWLKAPDKFWRQGEVIASFLMSMFSRFPSPAFAHLGAWDQVLTWGTLAIEASVPLLLWNPRLRWLGFALGLGLHAAIGLLGRLEVFFVVMLPLYAAFLERRDFERAERYWRWLHSRLRPLERG